MLTTFDLAGIVSAQWRLPACDKDDLKQELSILGLALERKGFGMGYIRRSMRNKSIDFLRERAVRSLRFTVLEEAQDIIDPCQMAEHYLSEALELEQKIKNCSEISKLLLNLIKEGRSITESAGLLKVPRKQASRMICHIRGLLK